VDPVCFAYAPSFDTGGEVVSYAWDFGDGTTAAGAEVLHTYAQDGAYTVTLVVTDDHGLSDTVSTTATVVNVAPMVAAFAGATLLPGETYLAAGSFTDPGADAWSATVDYGDGSGENALALAGTTFMLSHVYEQAGTFTVKVSIADDHVTSTGSQTVTVLTPDQALGVAIGLVDLLVSEGKLSPTISKGLKNKLLSARRELQDGHVNEAIEALEGLVEQIDSLVMSGKVLEEDVEPLRTLALRVARSLSR
jgi:PKD repeat protein